MSDIVALGAVVRMSNRTQMWFLGPKAENSALLKRLSNVIAGRVIDARRNMSGNLDSKREDFLLSEAYKEEVRRLETTLTDLMSSFCQKSIPFWSPRYSAYMCTDPSLPALLGYITAMFFNSNNVSTDVSPLTTAVERHAGLQLCEMLGFNMSHVSNDNGPWGHITSGGSIANLESMWAARNLKFYPLALRMAIDSPLSFLQAKFKVTLCDGMTLKAMSACTPWELVNLAPDTISGLSKRLEAEHGISPVYLSNVLKRYLVQRIGRNEIEHYFGLSAGKYFVASSKHYSWPKCAALTGIGSDNVVNIAVDKIARLDINALDRQLQLCLVNQTPIYAVVAIIGSTIHGAVDPLADIIALRRKYQRKGLSFIIHADAAWGGYFAAMLREPPTSENYIAEETALSSYSETQLYNLRFCDSVTVDPHKMGYAPYPAGALCYRDGRMRLFVSWKPAEVHKVSDGESSMGVYGVEGSKPGAASVSVWASHKVIGLHMSGYGSIMARALLSAVQFYCHWATMTTADSVLIVVPLHELPFEHGPLSSSLALQTQKQHIQSTLLFRSPEELSQDPVTMRLVKHLGSDLSINTFSINFRVDGVTNDSTVEANYLARRISDRLRKGGSSSADVPLFLRDIQMAADLYGVCAAHMKERLGLPTSAEDLHVLTNVVMSPFITSEDLSHSIAGFRRLAEQEIQACIFRNKAVPETLHFAVQGRARDNHLHLILLPMFHLAGLRHQLILEVTVPPDVAQRYNYTLSIFSPDQIFTLSTANEEMIEEILDRRTFNAVLNQELPGPHLRQVETAFRITDVRVVVHRSLHDRAWAPAYPQHMPFLLYGTPQDVHLMHVLVRAPNFHLSAPSVGVYVEDGVLSAADLAHGMLAVAKRILEAPIQPVQSENSSSRSGDSNSDKVTTFLSLIGFLPGNAFEVDVFSIPWTVDGSIDDVRLLDLIYKYPNTDTDTPCLARANIMLGPKIVLDTTAINADPAEGLDIEKELEQIKHGDTQKTRAAGGNRTGDSTVHGGATTTSVDKLEKHLREQWRARRYRTSASTSHAGESGGRNVKADDFSVEGEAGAMNRDMGGISTEIGDTGLVERWWDELPV